MTLRTNSEALEGWCPFRPRIVDVHPGLDGGQPEYKTCCLGDLCMWWRWGDRDETKGFCGVAGRPS